MDYWGGGHALTELTSGVEQSIAVPVVEGVVRSDNIPSVVDRIVLVLTKR